jgi:hypothetical protein
VKNATTIFALLLICGCQPRQEKVSEERLERLHTKSYDAPTGVKQQPVAVLQGTTPLVHIFDVGGPIRVVDLTDNAQIASTTVAARTLVRIDDRHGVIAGDTTIAPGPLTPGHTYVIYADPTTDNQIHVTVGPAARKQQPSTTQP